METQVVLSLANVLTILGGFAFVLGMFYKLLVKKFDKIDADMDKISDKMEAGFKEVRSEFKSELHEFRSEYRSELHEFRRESQENYNKLDNKIDHLGDRVGKVENRLTKVEMEVKNTNQRLITIEGYLVPKKIYRIEHIEEDEPKEN